LQITINTAALSEAHPWHDKGFSIGTPVGMTQLCSPIACPIAQFASSVFDGDGKLCILFPER